MANLSEQALLKIAELISKGIRTDEGIKKALIGQTELLQELTDGGMDFNDNVSKQLQKLIKDRSVSNAYQKRTEKHNESVKKYQTDSAKKLKELNDSFKEIKRRSLLKSAADAKATGTYALTPEEQKKLSENLKVYTDEQLIELRLRAEQIKQSPKIKRGLLAFRDLGDIVANSKFAQGADHLSKGLRFLGKTWSSAFKTFDYIGNARRSGGLFKKIKSDIKSRLSRRSTETRAGAEQQIQAINEEFTRRSFGGLQGEEYLKSVDENTDFMLREIHDLLSINEEAKDSLLDLSKDSKVFTKYLETISEYDSLYLEGIYDKSVTISSVLDAGFELLAEGLADVKSVLGVSSKDQKDSEFILDNIAHQKPIDIDELITNQLDESYKTRHVLISIDDTIKKIHDELKDIKSKSGSNDSDPLSWLSSLVGLPGGGKIAKFLPGAKGIPSAKGLSKLKVLDKFTPKGASKLKTFGKFIPKGLGKLIPGVGAAIEAITTEGSIGRKLFAGAGNLLGGIAGGALGTLIGGPVGTVAGGIGGSVAGGKGGTWLYDKLFGESNQTTNASSQAIAAPPIISQPVQNENVVGDNQSVEMQTIGLLKQILGAIKALPPDIASSLGTSAPTATSTPNSTPSKQLAIVPQSQRFSAMYR